jgi:hypothetical protein
VLGGEASWEDVGAAFTDQAAFIRRFTAEQDVQTNEVQRAWALLPAFLALAGDRPFDLLELGPSAGLNLVFDRYRYRYTAGTWGDGPLELHGHDRIPVPPEILRRRISVVRRRGVDLNPVDATTEHGARLLQAFLWPDQVERRERLQSAIEVLRTDPPELVRGDYTECLPELLADRTPGSQLVVFQTASTMYLARDAMAGVRAALQQASLREPLVFLNAEAPGGEDGFSLQFERYPGGQRERVAVFDFHGAWLDWGR